MINRSRHDTSKLVGNRQASAFAILVALFAVLPAQAQDRTLDSAAMGNLIVGNWYLALDAGAFDPGLAGFFLSGMAQFHADRTFMLNDAGDFGAQSFLPTLATPQYGSWAIREAKDGKRFVAGTSLYLEGDRETGEAIGWNKVQFALWRVGVHRIEGTINAFFLPCGDLNGVPTPLTCPDPLANAAGFIPASPPDVPVAFSRILVED